jgi:hypothetical protein
VPAHQLPGALHGVPDVEQLADQRLDPAQRPEYATGPPVSGEDRDGLTPTYQRSRPPATTHAARRSPLT